MVVKILSVLLFFKTKRRLSDCRGTANKCKSYCGMRDRKLAKTGGSPCHKHTELYIN